MNAILAALREDLNNNTDDKTRESVHRFFKEKVISYGVKTSLVTKISKKYFTQIEAKGKDYVFGLCENLFKSGYNEEAWIAANWAYWVNADFVPEDFVTFRRWIEKYIDNWAKCDTLCNHAVGAFIEKYPEYISGLKEWAASGNRWMRRAAAVTLIIPAKKGMFLKDIFCLADLMLEDEDDMVRKGTGWMLKEASRVNTQPVFKYVMKNKKIMPRTTLRYVIENMPPDLKKQAMAK